MNTSPTEKFRTSVGGQALMEGIMMRGPQRICCAVRRPDGTIDLTEEPVTTHWYNRVPLVRGVCNMVQSLVTGYKYLSHSAEISLTEEEQEEELSAFDRWLEAHAGPRVQNALMAVSALLGVALAVFLFLFLPTFLTGLLGRVVALGRWPRVLLEAAFKLALFLSYMALISRMKEIRRMFQYHGAEHKTIACYEAGLPLTVENVRKQPRHHPRCGTSFLFMVIAISIIVSTIVFAIWPVHHPLLRFLAHLLMLPIIVGVSYEFNRWAGRHDGPITKILTAPGLWLQNFTTFEPDDSMIEVGITALKLVLPEVKGEDAW